MASIHPNVTVTHEQIAAFCQKWQIVQFELFGSVVRDDFRPDSDVDVLVTFAPGSGGTLYDLVHMEDELKALFGREVDLVERAAIERSENYIRRRNILSSTRPVYAA
jgi:predicted nucleotidyltransferase